MGTVLKMKHASYRLSQDSQEELSWLFCQFESTVGIRSNFAAMAAAMALGEQEFDPNFNGMHIKHSSPSSTWVDPYTSGMLKSIGRSRLIRERLLDMIEEGYSLSVNVLYAMFGPQRRNDPFITFGELAPVVTWTSEAQYVGDHEAIDMAIRGKDGDRFKRKLTAAADRLFSEACRKYAEVSEREISGVNN